MSNSLLARFREHAAKSARVGQNGLGGEARYVPRSSLQKYWDEKDINEILQSCKPLVAENAKQIKSNFIHIFSILTYIGQPQDINLFLRKNWDDHRLPFRDFPPSWLPGLERFLEDQWMFCPLDLPKESIYKRELLAKTILPVKYEETLREEGSGPTAAHVVKVLIDPEYNNLDENRLTKVCSPFLLALYLLLKLTNLGRMNQ